ncbi:thioredoxin domain-containing protein [Sphingomonas sp. 3-13AW]|uniref:thioredoxin domain-containing protein n=1 Tax=Sphingomonas sp. 3-13AW TaxID=3050450 RepID=UPI003BB679E0
MRITTLFAAALLAAAPVAAAATPAPAPAPAPLSSQVIRTDDGYLMGNPKAPVKLVVLSAFGCPHCRIIDGAMMPPLKRDWIDTGKVSLRYVPYGMFPTDVPSLFLSECGRVDGFFNRSGRIFKIQQVVTSAFAGAPSASRSKIAEGPAANVPGALASLSGLTNYAPRVGVTQAAFRQCLSNPGIRQAISKRQKVIEARYKFVGTPAIWINGKPTGTGSSWPKLEALLKAASR